ncbi:MAG TPA: anti-sigma factor antagonist [Pseudoneobacillus sp.]|nr:anti-sigma factor antagonist [Pseudoneobacillus sp.]
MNITVEVNENEKDIHVYVSGEIDVYTAPKLKEKMLPLSEKEEVVLIVDLTSVSYMDSTGLGVIVGVFKSVRKHNGHFQLKGLSDRLTKLFKITGLADIMDISVIEGEAK